MTEPSKEKWKALAELHSDLLAARETRIAELERDQMGFDEQIMTADQRIAELEKDRERLDWFERVRPDVSMDWKGIWHVSIGQGTREVTQFEGGTLRETIDAAREEKS